ncbi:MAG: FAD-dependent oxidoreductase [Betaproteobacteria bacterium]|nr:MAG: FAD-dependent oxidoreductase [Betaproteobacteria bacterium]
MKAEIAVIGGGPGGMSAALAASKSGAHVVLMDEYTRLGGQFFKRAASDFELATSQLSAEHRAGEELRKGIAASKVEVLSGTLVWAVFGKTLMLYREGRSFPLEAGAVVIAAGAYDRPVAFPGWTLPGVMSAGGAQTIARTQWVKPGSRILIAGAGPFVMPVAQQVLRTGAEIVAIVEATRPAEWLRYAGSLWGQWPRFREAFKYWQSLRQVPVLYGHKVMRAIGTGQVEAVEIAAVDNAWRALPGTLKRYEVDALAIAYGFLPNIEAADGCGCEMRWDPYGQTWFVRHDSDMGTSVPGVYAAGEITGIAGSAVAMEEGRIAGVSAAEFLGRIPTAEAERLRAPFMKSRRHLMRFADALSECFRPRPGLWEGLEDATTVCRCEEVTAGDVRSCVRAGCSTVKAIKDWTRAGMGPCQGRICRNLVAQLIAEEASTNIASIPRPRIRPPFKPVAFDAMAQSE